MFTSIVELRAVEIFYRIARPSQFAVRREFFQKHVAAAALYVVAEIISVDVERVIFDSPERQIFRGIPRIERKRRDRPVRIEFDAHRIVGKEAVPRQQADSMFLLSIIIIVAIRLVEGVVFKVGIYHDFSFEAAIFYDASVITCKRVIADG